MFHVINFKIDIFTKWSYVLPHTQSEQWLIVNTLKYNIHETAAVLM